MIEKIGLPHRETIDATTEHAEEIERNAGNVVKTMEENKRMDTNSGKLRVRCNIQESKIAWLWRRRKILKVQKK